MNLNRLLKNKVITLNESSGLHGGVYQLKRFVWGALLSLLLLMALPNASFAQSALTDDAHVALSQGTAISSHRPALKR